MHNLLQKDLAQRVCRIRGVCRPEVFADSEGFADSRVWQNRVETLHPRDARADFGPVFTFKIGQAEIRIVCRLKIWAKC